MQFDAVEARFLGAQRRVGEQAGQRRRQVADVGVLHVGDALAVTELQRLPFARREHALKLVRRLSRAGGRGLRRRAGRARRALSGGRSVTARKRSKNLSRSGRRRMVEEIDELNEQPGAALAGAVHGVGETLQSRQEAVVADTQ